jgi:hypothetical protein
MKLKNTLLGIVAGTALLTFSQGNLFAQEPPPPGAGYQHGEWETPPPNYSDAGRRGYFDGIEGARKDFENHRQPNVRNRDEYRHPNVPGPQRSEYRDAFRRGYDNGVRHIMNGGPRP